MKKKLFLLMISLTITLCAQEIKFLGEAKQGGIIIGEGKDAVSASLNNTKLQIDENGIFLFGFDRDAVGKYLLKVKFKNKKVETFEYDLEKKQYEEQKLRLANKYVTPPKKLRNRIQFEAQLIKSARAKVGKVKDALFMEGFVYPVDSVDIRATFGLQRILNGKSSNVHNGLDFGGVEGDSIRVITNGIVRIAGKDFFYNGNFVLLDHGQGLTSVYLHMSKIFAKENQKVKKGEVIGLVGSTGRATGPHLHLGVQWYKKRIDPMSLLVLTFNK
ncbi:MAG: M23 family metallopeptidase [Ignavibacteriales bacterium]|nr:M23 family metallopeptidase [Ignavibacteriales bacterium]